MDFCVTSADGAQMDLRVRVGWSQPRNSQGEFYLSLISDPEIGAPGLDAVKALFHGQDCVISFGDGGDAVVGPEIKSSGPMHASRSVTRGGDE